ncbi:MATE family efflux transporter [Elongatibacter sediminis]|uniref:MATE family efflux transporter n=1 Tax=Elongatibacter sediminis TaxID=3119006 RepID=A0AAW9RFT9_9GAMM
MTDLTTGPVGGHLRRQAAAFSLGLVAIFSFEAVDLYFISRLGDAPLAAVAFTFPVIWLVYGIGIGFEAGTASVVSRAIGRKDGGRARRLTTDSTVLATAVLGIIGLVGLGTIDPVFRLLGATDDLMLIIRDYMGVWYWLAPMDACLWTCLASLRARGRADVEARIITTTAILNLILDPIFIFGLFGFPQLEVMGAALATLVSTATMLGVSMWILAARMQVFANPFVPLAQMIESWRHMLTIGLPAVLTNTIIPFSSAIVVSMIAAYGVDAVAGFGVAARIEPFALLVFYSLSAVASPFFGQNFSADQHGRLFEARRLITGFCLGYGLLLAIVMALLARPITGLFSDSETIRQVAVHYIWLVAWGYGAHGLVMSVNAAFNGTGRPLPGVVISVSRVIVLFLPLAFLGRWLIGLEGIFAATTICNVLLAVLGWHWLGRHIASHAHYPQAEATASPPAGGDRQAPP